MGTHPIFESDFDCLTDCSNMALISTKDVDKFNVKLVEGGNSRDFALNSSAALAPKHEDLQVLAASIATADEHIVSSAHEKLVQIAEQIKILQKQANDILQKAKDDQILAHAACNFEKKPGQVYHLYRNCKADTYQWSMLSLTDYKGVAPRGTEFCGSYKFETDRSFTKMGSKSDERVELEKFVTEMLSNPTKSIGFGPSFS